MKSTTKKAIKAAGGVAKLAKKCRVSYEAVRKWKVSGKVPVERVLEVEKLSGISRHELRPDFYPREAA